MTEILGFLVGLPEFWAEHLSMSTKHPDYQPYGVMHGH